MNWTSGHKRQSFRAKHNDTEYLVAYQYCRWHLYSISPGSTGWYLLKSDMLTSKEAMRAAEDIIRF